MQRRSFGRATRAWIVLPSWMIDGSPTISHAPSRSVKRSPMRSWIAKSTWVHSRSARGRDDISFHPGSVPALTARRRTHPVQELHRLVQRRGITDVMLRRVVASLPRCQVVRLHRRIRVRRFRSWLVGVGGGPKPDLGQETTRNHEANEVVPLIEDQADGEAAELRTSQGHDERRNLICGDGLAQPSLDRVALSSHIHDDVVSSVRVYPNPRQTPPA